MDAPGASGLQRSPPAPRTALARRLRLRAQSRERRKRFGLLLASLMAVFAVEGISTPGRLQQVTVSVLLAITIALALWVAEVRRAVIVPSLVVSGVVSLAGIVASVAGQPQGVAVSILNLLLAVMAPPAIVVGTARTLRARKQVTVEAVFGVLCLYLLLGMLFAFLYVFIGKANGGAFFAGHQSLTAAHALYFSFITLTTVGYGDFTAASNLGHTLSSAEALVGQIYLVTIVSLIVGNLGLRRMEVSDSDEPQAGR
ncbi:MAG TPA: potassium channel family protein [Solirubrobacteraceae bacterium]|nr:potassium channel family protein [Solirubrobacteraceae bacterium]